jgi:hypothetical protein
MVETINKMLPNHFSIVSLHKLEVLWLVSIVVRRRYIHTHTYIYSSC